MIFLVYCSVFYYVFVLSPGPTSYIFLLLWHDIACAEGAVKHQENKQTRSCVPSLIVVDQMVRSGQETGLLASRLSRSSKSRNWHGLIGYIDFPLTPKIVNFYELAFILRQRRGVPLDLCNGAWTKKQSGIMRLSVSEKNSIISYRFHTVEYVSARDRPTLAVSAVPCLMHSVAR